MIDPYKHVRRVVRASNFEPEYFLPLFDGQLVVADIAGFPAVIRPPEMNRKGIVAQVHMGHVGAMTVAFTMCGDMAVDGELLCYALSMLKTSVGAVEEARNGR
ncbi:hypothetical protein KRX51_03135 [Corynebacterium sp. TAE3-ERU12]|uniref:hypothetical protein n=1 Tax=Corynebacterium sp. TAE3-ERU12 TaxID=2849491 RepID=UPI001C454E10|nr:hypothetical protein [Corynebacterium sp. TAE3-ERU12]MBV7294912.1 hypothetical protein [Corynebacterium sp. TAE3-ERU12]